MRRLTVTILMLLSLGRAMYAKADEARDAQVLAARCPGGMLFVPSIGGRSHCPEEATDPVHLALGTRVLARALELLAY